MFTCISILHQFVLACISKNLIAIKKDSDNVSMQKVAVISIAFTSKLSNKLPEQNV